ncbi:hypothetical protein D7X33_21080 [Butyricicoccus sp. 1XD8-22]|nr:hypothetical protein D7X33_21080 [Butyricicoccus sp. 1XD8-22]
MQSFIVSAFMLIFFFMGLTQFVNEQEMETNRSGFALAVENAAQHARMEGYFTPEIKADMLQAIEDQTTISQSEVQIIELTESPVCTRQGFSESNQIHYKIAIPIKNVIAGASFLGITEEENMYWYPQQGSVASEKVCKG